MAQNPYEITPMGGYGPSIVQGIGGIADQYRADQEAEQQQQAKAAQQTEMQSAFDSGDPNQVSKLILKYPDARDTITAAVGHRDETTKANMAQTIRAALANPDKAPQIIQARIDALRSVYGEDTDLDDSLEAALEAKESPEQFLKGLQMMAPAYLSEQEWDAYSKRMEPAEPPKIGTYNPRDYTVESFTKFAESQNPADLERYTEKTIDIGGVAYQKTADGTYTPVTTVKKTASNKAQIAEAVTLATEDARAKGETLTTLKRAEAALPGLMETVDALKALAPTATSTAAGRAWNAIVKESGFGSTEGATARAKFIAIINNQVLPLLKPTFGAQFTVQEGEALRSTMGDKDATPEEKIAVLEAFLTQKMRSIRTAEREVGPAGGQQKAPQSAIDYLSANPQAAEAFKAKYGYLPGGV